MAARGFTRGELARRTGCHLETIRHYERIGLLPDPRTSGGGYRWYGRGHEDRLHFIMRGRELGFSTDDIRCLLDLVDRRSVSCARVKATAQDHIARVRQKIGDLQRIEQVLSKTLQACSGDEVPDCPLVEALFIDRASVRN